MSLTASAWRRRRAALAYVQIHCQRASNSVAEFKPSETVIKTED